MSRLDNTFCCIYNSGGYQHEGATLNGLEFTPVGSLLKQVTEITPSMGITYLRSLKFSQDFHCNERMALVFPRGNTRLEVRTKSPFQRVTFGKEHCLIIPASVLHDAESMSFIYDTITLLPDSDLLLSISAKLGLDNTQADSLHGQVRLIKRTPWLDQLVQSYLFERVMNRGSAQEELQFLESQIMHEVLATVFVPSKARTVAQLPAYNDDIVTLALKYIEINLFETLDIELIASYCSSSTSTLFRLFKAQMGMGPIDYIKKRKLDEAMCLLRQGGRSAGEVALLVAQDNFSTFTAAFKQQFGIAPSAVRSSVVELSQ